MHKIKHKNKKKLVAKNILLCIIKYRSGNSARFNFHLFGAVNMKNLCLHCGANEIDFNDPILQRIPESKGDRHAPIPHKDYLDMLISAITNNGLMVSNQAIAATKDGDRMFGLLQVADAGIDSFITEDGQYVDREFKRDEFSTIIGIRASHDKSISAGLVCGSGVFVCDNLMFNGEIKFGTKQTLKLLDRLPMLIDHSINLIKMQRINDNERMDKYQSVELTQTQAHDAMIRLLRVGAINTKTINNVITEWDTPSYDEFAERQDLYRMLMAVTENYKPRTAKEGETPRTNLHNMTAPSIKAIKCLDEIAGLTVEPLPEVKELMAA